MFLNLILLMAELNARRKLEEERPLRLAAIEQQRQECRRNAEAAAAQRAQEARIQNRDRERGYRRISLETFVLDGKDLSARAAKVSLRGSYLQHGNIEYLFADQVAVIKVTRYPQIGRNEPRAALLTGNAPRESRQYLLRCRTHPGAAQVGCAVTVLGRITMCELSGPLEEKRPLPCVAVEEARP